MKNISTLNSNINTTNDALDSITDNVENRSKGIEYKTIGSDGAYSKQVSEKADYFIIATANAKDANANPIIRIYINNSLFRMNAGGIGNSVTTFLSVSLNSGDSVKIEFESVVTNNAYNSYFIMQLKKNY